MEKKIIIATGNEGKMKEIRMILSDLGVPVLSLKEAGISAEIAETGNTFEENALIKAKTVAKLTKAVVLADDSGLEIDYLNREPGIYSARYLGEDTSYAVKNQTLLERMEGVPDAQRTARFVCVVAAAWEDQTATARGVMEGRIAYKPAGDNGYLPEYGCTSAQISPEQKNEISHRGKAFCAIKEKIRDILR